MSRKAILFTTRFLENNGGLFDASSIINCEHAFENNKPYCEFFLNKDTREELKRYLCDEYYKEKLSCILEKNTDNLQGSLDDLMTTISESDSCYDEILDEIEQSRSFSTLDEGGENKTFLFPKRLEYINDVLYLKEETVDKEDLVKYIKFCKDENLKKLRINIDCPDDYESILSMRFKLYKLKLTDDSIVAYAVWPLHKTCDNNSQAKWYEALCTEIINDNIGKKIDEITLFLHDVDIKSNTPFTIWEKNVNTGKYHFLPDDISLNVVLFQHSNDPVASILHDSSSEKITAINKAINLVSNAKCGAIVYELLGKMDEVLASWQIGTHESLSVEFIKDATLLKESWNEAEWEVDFPNVNKILCENLDINQNLITLNTEINNALRKLTKE